MGAVWHLHHHHHLLRSATAGRQVRGRADTTVSIAMMAQMVGVRLTRSAFGLTGGRRGSCTKRAGLFRQGAHGGRRGDAPQMALASPILTKVVGRRSRMVHRASAIAMGTTIGTTTRLATGARPLQEAVIKRVGVGGGRRGIATHLALANPILTKVVGGISRMVHRASAIAMGITIRIQASMALGARILPLNVPQFVAVSDTAVPQSSIPCTSAKRIVIQHAQICNPACAAHPWREL